MTTGFGRRLLLLTTVEIAGVLCAVVLAIALFAFGAYVKELKSELAVTNDQLALAIQEGGASHDASAAAKLAALRFLRSDLVVLLTDPRIRVNVFRLHRGDQLPLVRIRAHGDLSGDPRTTSPLALPIVGLATAFGLQVARSHVGGVDLFVKESDSALVAAIAAYLPAVLVAFLIAIAAGYAFARILTRQALRPLVDVTGALERFAAGEIAPQPIEADRRHELGRLAVAYNDAIAQMQRAFAERERANAAMRQFIADAGHQLRTPLTVIRGFIAILRKGELRRPEDRERILETMNQQSQIMGEMIEKLMLLDQWEREDGAPVPHPIDVAQLVADVVAPIAEANPARTVRVEADPGPLASIDPSDLTYAVTNVVDNALKYTSGAVAVCVTGNAEAVCIDISDEGPGMTRDEIPRVFDRFFRGDRRHVEGSGLGLTIARRAVERAGGSLVVESGADRGSRFVLTLPAARRSSGAQNDPPARAPETPVSGFPSVAQSARSA